MPPIVYSQEQLTERMQELQGEFNGRRKAMHELNNEIQRIVGMIDLIKANSDLHKENGKKIDAILEGNYERDALLKKLVAGFPGGDADAHRRYHETLIESRELRNKIVREALVKVSSAGVLTGTGWLLYAAWEAFKTGVKQ